MIDDEERKRVAANFRQYLKKYETPDWRAFCNIILGSGRLDNLRKVQAFDRLADLIDRPTYRPVILNEMDGGVFCPQCGTKIGEYGVPNYCYNCGVAIRNYKAISDAIGHDIVDFYARNSAGSGYLRLNRAIKEPYVRKMRDLCHEVGMRFYVSDAHFKEACDNACCCGLPDDWKISRCQFSEALQLCRRNGRVTFSEIGGDADFLEFSWGAAEGFNTGSVERMAKFAGMTMRDYLRWLWNNPKAGQSPYAMFEGVMLPDGLDEHGDVIYRWNQSRTFVEGGE